MVEEDGKHLLALKSGPADLLSVVVRTQPCFVPAYACDATEWYPGPISCDDTCHTFGFI